MCLCVVSSCFQISTSRTNLLPVPNGPTWIFHLFCSGRTPECSKSIFSIKALPLSVKAATPALRITNSSFSRSLTTGVQSLHICSLSPAVSGLRCSRSSRNSQIACNSLGFGLCASHVAFSGIEKFWAYCVHCALNGYVMVSALKTGFAPDVRVTCSPASYW